jgi:hypothetical protein
LDKNPEFQKRNKMMLAHFLGHLNKAKEESMQAKEKVIFFFF